MSLFYVLLGRVNVWSETETSCVRLDKPIDLILHLEPTEKKNLSLYFVKDFLSFSNSLV